VPHGYLFEESHDIDLARDAVNVRRAFLSTIERKVLDRVRKGLTIEAIARELDPAQGTVELHIEHSLLKLRVRSGERINFCRMMVTLTIPS
jgi:DNA-binding NarL/FixJ family response regulator